MSIDVRVDQLDEIAIHADTQEKLNATVAFAMKDQGRMRSFFATMDYLLNWGRGVRRESPTKVQIFPDFTLHSYGFTITTYRWDDEKMAIVENKPMLIMMYYRASDDRWETHS